MVHVFQANPPELQPRAAAVADFAWHTSPRFAQLAGSKLLQVDVRSLDAGRFSFPYHFHRASEEFFLVLSGRLLLRTADGVRPVRAGELVFCEAGPTGAHQLHNPGPEPAVYLDVRATPPGGLDVTEYPDSGKVAILPIGTGDVYEAARKVDYYHGEADVRSHWPTGSLG